MKRARNETCRPILDFEGHERLDEGRSKTTTTHAEERAYRVFSITDACSGAIPPSRHWSSQGECIEPRESEREGERVGNRAINNYRMKKGARYPPGAPKPRLHTPSPSLATPRRTGIV